MTGGDEPGGHDWQIRDDESYRHLPVADPVCRCEEPHTGRCLLPSQRWLILEDFTKSMRRRGLAEGSIDSRLNIVRRWWIFIGDPFHGRVKWRHVARFIDESAMNAPNTRYSAVSHIHMFYVWAQRVELTKHDPTLLMERPRLPRRLPRPAHDTDLALALALSDGPTRAAFLLAATSGLRCVELARLRWVDVNESSLRVTGKGGKDRVVPLHVAARVALDELDRPDDYVFPWREKNTTAPGGPLSRALNKYLRSIGCDMTMHQLRHWCGTNALAATNDLRAVQELLGHASPATTAIYAALDVTRLRVVVDAIQVPGVDSFPAVDAVAAVTPRHTAMNANTAHQWERFVAANPMRPLDAMVLLSLVRHHDAGKRCTHPGRARLCDETLGSKDGVTAALKRLVSMKYIVEIRKYPRHSTLADEYGIPWLNNPPAKGVDNPRLSVLNPGQKVIHSPRTAGLKTGQRTGQRTGHIPSLQEESPDGVAPPQAAAPSRPTNAVPERPDNTDCAHPIAARTRDGDCGVCCRYAGPITPTPVP